MDKTMRVLPSGIQFGNDDFVIVLASGSLALTYDRYVNLCGRR